MWFKKEPMSSYWYQWNRWERKSFHNRMEYPLNSVKEVREKPCLSSLCVYLTQAKITKERQNHYLNIFGYTETDASTTTKDTLHNRKPWQAKLSLSNHSKQHNHHQADIQLPSDVMKYMSSLNMKLCQKDITWM